MAVAIGIKGVSRHYGEIAALDDITLDIGSAEFFTLLGSSGCGKSTLLKMIGGFERPDRGIVSFDGRDMSRLGPNQRPVNTVFQDLALFPHMSVGANVGYGLVLRGEAPDKRRRRVAEALELVALGGFENRDVNLLSGGQKQRVALARALVMEPGVLLLDEPLTGLDERLRQQLRDEFGRLHKRTGATFVLVTHNQDEALSLSDRMAIMHQGRIVQTDTVHDVLDRPADAFVARFMGLDPLLVPDRVEGDLATIAGQCLPFTRVGSDAPGRMLIAFRPDKLSPAPSDGAGDATLELTVRAIQFRGLHSDLSLAFADGQTITMQVTPDKCAGLSPGAAMRVAMAPGAALLIPEGKEADGPVRDISD